MTKQMRAIITVLILLISVSLQAQVTTASMSGNVTDPNNEAITEATIQATHEPSGTPYAPITNITARL